ncbi:uncharacterized protein LOC144767916 [Lissotriton helveticus]
MVISLKSWRPGGRVHGRWGWIHTVWVTSLFQCTAAQLSITPDVVTAAVGDTVTLSVRHEGRLEDVVWVRGEGTDGDDIFLYLSRYRPPVYGLQSTGRESVLPDGSLRITDVQTYHSGNYTVRMYIDLRRRHEATAQLRVHEVPLPSDASSWWVTLAVASGMLIGAVVAVLGVVLLYKRCTKKVNGATPGGSRRVIYETAVNYVNVENANQVQPAQLPSISLLPKPAKILEKIVQEQLSDYVESNGLLHDSQSGFRTGYSTETALLEVVETVRETVDGGEAQSPDADRTYMALKHGDQATYGHL